MKTVCIIFLFICGLTGTGKTQKISQTHNISIYQHGDNLYTLDQLSDVFTKNPVAYYHYESFRRNQNLANIAGFVTLSMFAGGVSLILIIQEPSDCKQRVCITKMEWFGGFMILLSPIPGIFGITTQIAATRHKKKAFDIYNQEYTILPLGNEKINLSFSNTQHGIGLTMRF